MNSFSKKFLALFLFALMLTAACFSPSQAFMNCKKCSKKSFFRTAIGIDNDDEEANNNDDLGNDAPDDEDAGKADPGAADGEENDNEACARNFEALEIAKGFLACQIRSSTGKTLRPIRLYKNLQKRVEALIRVMSRAPVCTNNGYMPDEFTNDHSLENNLENLRKIRSEIKGLLTPLNNVSLTCDNCEDENELNAALAEVDAIADSFNDKVDEFTAEIDIMEDRFADFIARLNEVTAAHGTSVTEIMLECGVKRKKARAMSRARKIVLKSIDGLTKYKTRFDNILAKKDYTAHSCVEAAPADKVPNIPCGKGNLNIVEDPK